MKYLSTLNIVRRQQKVFTASLNEECGQQVKTFSKNEKQGEKEKYERRIIEIAWKF